MIWTTLTVLFGIGTFAVLAFLAWAFWRDPQWGMAQATHRPELLPRVMADRYTAFAVLELVFLIYGDLNVLAAFFAVCAFMGLADGAIYARAGHPHIKHTISGVLSAIGFGVALTAIFVQGGA